MLCCDTKPSSRHTRSAIACDVKDRFVIPWTQRHGSRRGIRMNPASSAAAQLMSSQAWGEDAQELFDAGGSVTTEEMVHEDAMVCCACCLRSTCWPEGEQGLLKNTQTLSKRHRLLQGPPWSCRSSLWSGRFCLACEQRWTSEVVGALLPCLLAIRRA